MHATIMIFFVVMPIMVGTFGNFLIPLMIGAGDMAFPKLNMLSFWVGAIATVVMLASFFVPGGPAAGGWTSYATLIGAGAIHWRRMGAASLDHEPADSRCFFVDGLDQLHHDDHQYESARNELFPHAADRLVAIRYGDSSAPGVAGFDRGARHAVVRPHGGN